MRSVMRIFSFILVFLIPFNVCADFTPSKLPASYILTDYDTGTVLAEYKADEPLPIASVTKVMTMLICMESIKSGKISFNDVVVASEHACSMGGSQIYLEPGEQMSVSDMLKSIAVSSANDACAALAEFIMGSEQSFVDVMNDRAKSLGMKNTHFVNCNGLDADGHYSSARDVSIMSRELLKYDDIRPFLTIWMDSVRDGKFGLSNTNKLIRFYEGAIGVKTGSTTNAKYCLSFAAKRDNLTLVGAVLGADKTSERFEISKELLNYGFSNYKINTVINKGENLGRVKVKKGVKEYVSVVSGDTYSLLTNKSDSDITDKKVVLPKNLNAPIQKGDMVGTVEILKGDKKIAEVSIKADETVQKIGIIDTFSALLKLWMLKY